MLYLFWTQAHGAFGRDQSMGWVEKFEILIDFAC